MHHFFFQLCNAVLDIPDILGSGGSVRETKKSARWSIFFTKFERFFCLPISLPIHLEVIDKCGDKSRLFSLFSMYLEGGTREEYNASERRASSVRERETQII